VDSISYGPTRVPAERAIRSGKSTGEAAGDPKKNSAG